MTDTSPEQLNGPNEVSRHIHAVVNSLAAVQCQWFLLKSALTPIQLDHQAAGAIDRLLSDLSNGIERLQTKLSGE